MNHKLVAMIVFLGLSSCQKKGLCVWNRKNEFDNFGSFNECYITQKEHYKDLEIDFCFADFKPVFEDFYQISKERYSIVGTIHCEDYGVQSLDQLNHKGNYSLIRPMNLTLEYYFSNGIEIGIYPYNNGFPNNSAEWKSGESYVLADNGGKKYLELFSTEELEQSILDKVRSLIIADC